MIQVLMLRCKKRLAVKYIPLTLCKYQFTVVIAVLEVVTIVVVVAVLVVVVEIY